MVSQSAYANSAREARFRIDASNSQPRAVSVIALDGASEALVRELARTHWMGARFLLAKPFAVAPTSVVQFPAVGLVSDLTGQDRQLIDEIDTADLVVLIVTAGADAESASIIGEACFLKRVMMTAFVLAGTSMPDEVLSTTLAQLRPWTQMLVVTSAAEHVADVLKSLRA